MATYTGDFEASATSSTEAGAVTSLEASATATSELTALVQYTELGAEALSGATVEVAGGVLGTDRYRR